MGAEGGGGVVGRHLHLLNRDHSTRHASWASVKTPLTTKNTQTHTHKKETISQDAKHERFSLQIAEQKRGEEG